MALVWGWIMLGSFVLTSLIDGDRVDWWFCLVAALCVAGVLVLLRVFLFEGRWARFFVSPYARWPNDENEVRWWTTFAVAGVATVLVLVVLETVWTLLF